MRKFDGMKKVLSAVLAFSMVLSYAPVTAFAVTEDGSCEHHTHDESCGYVAMVKGVECGHECSDACKTKQVTSCTHNHEAEGCTYTPAAEAVACDYVHGEGCNHVYAQDEVLCTCGAEPQHTAECASVLTEGADCDCAMPVTHAEGCDPQAAVAESCDHVHGDCAYREAVEESWSCGHVCSVENGCITFVCAHVCPEDNCGFMAAVEGSDCTFVCEECSAEPETEPTVLTITGWSWVDEYEILSEDGTYITLPNAADWETLKSILPTVTATVDGAEVSVPVQWECENFPAEGAAQGTFQLKAILPEGYALGEGVAALELEVDLGEADLYSTTWDGSSVATDFAGGTGTVTDPYRIETAAQLIYFRNLVNESNNYSMHVRLDADIDLANKPFGDPIAFRGTVGENRFKGVFDGNNKTISGLSINITSGSKNVGLFGTISGATIKNLTIANSTVQTTAKVHIGALAGSAESGSQIINCHNKNTAVTKTDTDTNEKGVGGLCGVVITSKIENCSNSGAIQGYRHVGGIYGYSGTTYTSGTGNQIISCTNSGAITSTDVNAGGIADYDKSTPATAITGCANTGTVNAKHYAGGIIGQATNMQISKCYNAGDVTSTDPSSSSEGGAGGICGNISSCVSVQISNCYNTGNVSAVKKAGGISGRGAAATISNCHNYGNISISSAQTYVGAILGEGSQITVQNCYYLNGSAKNGNNTTIFGFSSTANSNINQNAHGKTADEFADGTVYNLLQPEGATEKIWGQNIGTDSYPVFFNGSNIPVIKEAVTVSVTAVTTYTYDGTAKRGYTGTPTSGAYIEELEYVYVKDGSTTALTEAPKDAGTYTLIVKVPDTDEKYKGESAPITFTINPKPITITANAGQTMEYGSDAVPTLTYTVDASTPLVEGDTLTGALGTTATATSPVGTYNITLGTLNNDNYAITMAGDAKLQVVPKTLAINVTAISRAYAKDDKTVAVTEVTVEGKVGTDAVSVTIPSDFKGTLSSDAVGTYDKITIDVTKLTLSGGDAGNYRLPTSGENLATNVSIKGTIAETNVSGIETSYAYTGDAIQPVPVVTVNGVTLEKDTDYEVSYGSNTNAANDGTVTITGKGLYEGSATTKTFDITPVTITSDHIKLTPESAEFTGSKHNTVVEVTVTGKVLTAGTDYTVSGNTNIGPAIADYTITVTGKGNYAGNATKTYKITEKQLKETDVTVTANLTYTGTAQEPTIEVKNGETVLTKGKDYKVTYEKVNEDSTATAISGAPTDAGTYNVVITGSGTYGGTVKKSFEIKPNTTITVAPETLEAVTYTGEEIKPAVTVKGVEDKELVKDTDYTISYTNNVNKGTATVTITGQGNYAGAKKELTFTINAKELKQENVTLSDTVLGYDGNIQKPTVTVKDGDKVLEEGESKDYVVTIIHNGYQTAEPVEIGTYTLTVTGKGNYSGSVSQTYVITDDVTDPTIEGVTNGKTYYTTQKVTAKDTNLVSVTKNGTEISPVVSTGTEVTLQGNTTATYTVIAEDIAERKASVTISMKPISTLDDTIDNLTVDNVKPTDKDTIQAVLDVVTPIRENECGNATQAETDALDAIISKCNDLLGVIGAVEDVIDQIQKLPDPSTIQPYDETVIDAYEKAQDAYDKLSDHGKELVGEENKAKLDAVRTALTAYKITKGHKSSYVKGSYKTLTFTANGPVSKFSYIEVDSKQVDAKHYTVAPDNGTVITLKASYLETLSAGKHTIQVFYADGKTDTATFRISINNGNPFTGDNPNMLLFGGVAMTSLLCMAMMIVFFPRKKGKYQR